ncbi:MAG: glycerophosphodiester phosphodiesterase [Saprospiraceae bacterium]|nr:glycerophosphodiester phosphodiesterase [Saprospiraceae bacterium]
MHLFQPLMYLFTMQFLGLPQHLQLSPGGDKSMEILLPARGLCAHRGAMESHPENTLVAFQAAIDKGAHMIEFDVHLTSDRKLIVIHDNTVDRTTNGRGQVSAMTLEELKQLDAGLWKGPEFIGQKLPTFEEALAMMPVNIWLNVHLKSAQGIGDLVTREIVRQNRQHQAFLACSQAIALEAKAVYPDILICNMDRQSSDLDYVHLTITNNADFIQLKGEISTDYRKLVSLLQQHAIRINYFGTDDATQIATLFEYGVEFPLVNNIVETIQISTDLGILPVEPIYPLH